VKGLTGWSIAEDGRGRTVIDSPCGIVCALEEGTDYEQRARAAVIASAPELRDALQRLAGLAALIETRILAGGLPVYPVTWQAFHEATIAARNALRKAAGAPV
jgi:hypothetical protein